MPHLLVFQVFPSSIATFLFSRDEEYGFIKNGPGSIVLHVIVMRFA